MILLQDVQHLLLLDNRSWNPSTVPITHYVSAISAQHLDPFYVEDVLLSKNLQDPSLCKFF